MKFYVHIGVEKTGTTSIQDFLRTNRESLLGAGYFVPTAMGLRNHRKLPVAAYDADRRDDFTRSQNIHTNRQLEDYQRQIATELATEVAAHTSANIVLSSEQIQSRLTKPAEIQRLKDVLIGAGATEITIIVYLRDPAEIANSNYSTWIRCGDTDRAPPGPEHTKFKILCDHRDTLQKFSAVFGEDAIKARIYDFTSFRNGSLVEDFLEAIDCPWSDDFVMPEASNQALSPLGLEILRRFNEKIPVFVDDRPNALRGAIVKHINDHFVSNGKEQYVMPDSLFDAYQAAFSESNEWVRAHWFPDRPCLFEQKDRKKSTAIALPDSDLDRIVSMLVDIWTEKQQHTIAQQQQHTSLCQRSLNLVKKAITRLTRPFRKC